jgi:hypothetical protein
LILYPSQAPAKHRDLLYTLARNLSLDTFNSLVKTVKPVINENTVLDVFNIEVQRAVEYLNSIKPDYKGMFSEVLDFYSGIGESS